MLFHESEYAKATLEPFGVVVLNEILNHGNQACPVGKSYSIVPLVTVTMCLIFGGRSSFVTVVYGRFQNFPLEEFSENSALKGVLELTVHDCHTFMITAAHPAASGPAHTGLPWFSDD